MLDDIVDSSVCPGNIVGHSYLNAQSFEVYNIAFLVDSHVCGQRSKFMFSKRPTEHTSGWLFSSLCVGHFGGSER